MRICDWKTFAKLMFAEGSKWGRSSRPYKVVQSDLWEIDKRGKIVLR